MFSRLFTKIETYLAVVPFILAFAVNTITTDGNVHTYLKGNYITLSAMECLLLVYLMLAIPFGLHYFLKSFTKKYTAVAILHATASLILLVFATTIALQSPVWVSKWNESFLPPPVNETFLSDQNTLLFLMAGFAFLQIAFSFYGLERFFKYAHRSNENSSVNNEFVGNLRMAA